jgi:hypothetical protein
MNVLDKEDPAVRLDVDSSVPDCTSPQFASSRDFADFDLRDLEEEGASSGKPFEELYKLGTEEVRPICQGLSCANKIHRLCSPVFAARIGCLFSHSRRNACTI